MISDRDRGRKKGLVGLIVTGLVAITVVISWWVGSGVTEAQAPRTGIEYPFEGERLFGTVSVQGTAVIGDFVRYELAFRPSTAGDDAYIVIGGSAEEVIDGQLGVWQTEDLPAGLYSVRLRVIRGDGNYVESVIHNIIVDPTLIPTPTPVAPMVSDKVPPTAAVALSGPTLSVTAEGQVMVFPDQATVWLYLTLDPRATASRTDQLATLAAILAENGVVGDTIESDPYARSGPGILGSIRFTYQDLAFLDGLLQEVLQQVPADTVIGDVVVHFTVNTCSEQLIAATQLALADSREKAVAAATALGVTLGAVRSVTVEPGGGCATVETGGPLPSLAGINRADAVEIVARLRVTYEVSGSFSPDPLPSVTPDPAEQTADPTVEPEIETTVEATPTPPPDAATTPDSPLPTGTPAP